LSGYDGLYDFKAPGQAYGAAAFYGMRLFCAVCGALCVPLAFATVHALTQSRGAALLAAVAVRLLV
jgi:dolichyl-phosphate-mannose--protein O-mannosyl transferase